LDVFVTNGLLTLSKTDDTVCALISEEYLFTGLRKGCGFCGDLLASLEKLPSIPFAEVTMSLDSSLPLLRNPASSPCSTGKSSSPDGTRNPSVVHDFRLGDSFDLTIFSVSSVDSSVMLTLQSTL